MVGGIYSFGNEFKLAESTDDEISTLVANFSGNETAGYYGRGILTVQLFGSDGNIINSANVKVKITDSNSQEPFTPSVVFRDQILDAINGFDKHVEDKTAEIISEISTIKSEVETTGVNAVREVNAAKADAVGNVNTAKTGAVAEVNTAKTNALAEVGTAKSGALSDISGAKAGAVGDVNAAKTGALAEISTAGASYQRQISENSAMLDGAVWTSDVSASLGQILPRKQYPYGYDAWNYTPMPRSSAKYTVLGYYMPRSGGFSLFYESADETGYGSGACLKVEEDQKTIAYYNAYDSGNNSYVYETLDSPLIFGDCLAYVFDCGSVKVYRNKELLFERQIEDESYLSGNLMHFSNLLGGDNYKKSFLLSVGNAFPLEDEFCYSISDFVNGVEPPAGYLSKLSSINAPFEDATGLTLSQVTGTYSQSFSDETSCAKFVPSGLSSTSKKVRYFNFKNPYANERNATCKIRMKFYLPTSNANWKHIGFKPVGSYATWNETSNLFDANDCISAKDEWQTLEFTLKNGNGSFAPRFYFRPDSGTTTTSAAIGQAIASAGSDVFYLAEYVVEYPPAIDNYVKIPLQNGVFLQKGTIPYNMVFGLGMHTSSYCDINSLGDSGANNARSIAASQTLTGNPYLYVDSFDFVPYGRYCLSSITLKFADLSALADTDTITLSAIDSSYRGMTFTKSEVLNGQFTVHCENPNSYDLRSNDNYWNVSMYTSSGVQLSGDIIFNWERIN